VAGTDFWQLLFRPPLQVLQRAVLRSVFRLRVEGRSLVPRSGPFVVVANHQSHLDVPTVEAGLPLRHANRTHPLAAMDYFFERPGLGPVVHLGVNALPINRHVSTAQAMKAGLDLLAGGRRLIVFPEGSRSPDGSQAPFKQGIGYLLAGRPWPAVPMNIAGTREALPKGRARPRLARLRLTIGEPVSYEATASSTEGWRAVAADLDRRVRQLAGPP
jgi:1-acyl-sn-glycerol-3-phosphate acyltransferase